MNWVPKYPAQSDNVMALVANNAICTHVHLSGNFNMQWMQNLAQIHYFYIIWLGVCEMYLSSFGSYYSSELVWTHRLYLECLSPFLWRGCCLCLFSKTI